MFVLVICATILLKKYFVKSESGKILSREHNIVSFPKKNHLGKLIVCIEFIHAFAGFGKTLCELKYLRFCDPFAG